MKRWRKMRADPKWLPACWPTAPEQSVVGCTSTCHGGASTGAFASNNIRFDIGDDPSAVTANRANLLDAINKQLADADPLTRSTSPLSPAVTTSVQLQWIDQVHGSKCVYADESSLNSTPRADAAWTDKPGIGIAIQTADCVPILLTNKTASVVGAAHAGWRGLVANIINSLVVAMPAEPADLLAWIGPCIGLKHFEVGEDVWSVILPMLPEAVHEHSDDPSKRLVDLVAVARWQLGKIGVGSISAANICTYASADFYSYRQACRSASLKSGAASGMTGRMASVVVCSPNYLRNRPLTGA